MDIKGNNFKIGDKVRIRSNVTLKEIEENHFAGCQYSTMKFLLDQSSSIYNFNGVFEIDNVVSNGSIKLKNVDGILNAIIFEKINGKAIINTPKDLKFGDIVTTRNNERYVVANEILYGESENYDRDCDFADAYEDDFRYYDDKDDKTDIIKVERNGVTIWKREESNVKEMTVEEISKALGYDVKVVK